MKPAGDEQAFSEPGPEKGRHSEERAQMDTDDESPPGGDLVPLGGDDVEGARTELERVPEDADAVQGEGDQDAVAGGAAGHEEHTELDTAGDAEDTTPKSRATGTADASPASRSPVTRPASEPPVVEVALKFRRKVGWDTAIEPRVVAWVGRRGVGAPPPTPVTLHLAGDPGAAYGDLSRLGEAVTALLAGYYRQLDAAQRQEDARRKGQRGTATARTATTPVGATPSPAAHGAAREKTMGAGPDAQDVEQDVTARAGAQAAGTEGATTAEMAEAPAGPTAPASPAPAAPTDLRQLSLFGS